jgi:hypothetical protein
MKSARSSTAQECMWFSAPCRCSMLMRQWHDTMIEINQHLHNESLRDFLMDSFKSLFLHHHPHSGFLLIADFENSSPIVKSQPFMQLRDAIDCLDLLRPQAAALLEPPGWHILHDINPVMHNRLSQNYRLDGQLVFSMFGEGRGLLMVYGSELTGCPQTREDAGEHVWIIASRLSAEFELAEKEKKEIEPDNDNEQEQQGSSWEVTARLSRQIVSSLLRIINAQSAVLGTHPQQVAALAKALATKIKLPIEEVHHIHVATLVCDIGMVAITDAIALKPRRLTDEEWKGIRVHPEIGSEILGDIDLFNRQLPIVRHHHERWDGSGYPDGLAGDEIPIGSRIIAIADAYIHLQMERPFRKAYTATEAIAHIRALSNKHFDPQLVRALDELIQTDKYWTKIAGKVRLAS